MKKVLLALFLLFSTTVFADRVDDLKEAGSQELCNTQAYLFRTGIKARNYSAELNFKNISNEQAVRNSRNGIDPPKDGIYMIDFDKYTEQEKKYVVKHMS